jgi:AraC-like DNA-binding protein
MNQEQINSYKEFHKKGYNYQQLAPHKDIASFIDCFFVSEAVESSEKKITLRLVPDGHFDIYWYRGSHFDYEIRETGSKTSSGLIIAGQMSRATYLNIKFPLTLIGVKMFAHGLYPLLNIPMSGLTDKVFDFADLFPDSVELSGAMERTANRFEALRLLQSYLQDKYSKITGIDIVTCEIVQKIYSESGNITLKEISRIYDISPRQIERKFDRFVGLSPKTLARMVRFSKCLSAIQRLSDRKTLEIIHSYGYYDQTHFIKEFKSFVKLTPNEYKNWISSFKRN